VIAATVNLDVRSGKVFSMAIGGQNEAASAYAFRETINLGFDLVEIQESVLPGLHLLTRLSSSNYKHVLEDTNHCC